MPVANHLKILLLLLLISFPCNSFAQKENNIWYFGNGAGLDFNNGSPAVLTNSAMSGIDGSATISDANGKLLFYTNSIGIWNIDHQPMLNGGLDGDIDASQGALIVKQPGNSNIYYVFTNNKYSLSYAVVDMNGDGGKGEVIQKNDPFITGIHEALAGVWHCNGKDAWIVTHRLGKNELCAFLLDENGLHTTPILSSSRFASGARFGYIKFSPAGDKVAVGRGLTRDVYNFDNSSGKITGHVFTAEYNTNTNFNIGFDFSPDGTKLYVSSTDPVLYQYDLSAGDSIAIVNSRYDLPLSFTWGWAVALGPDKKLYFNGGDLNYLHCVHNPNYKGAACNVQEKAIYLQGKKASIGMPLYVAGKSSTRKKTAFEPKNLCFGNPSTFTIKDTSGLDSVNWFIKQKNGSFNYISSDKNPTVLLPDTGLYEVELIGFYPCNTDTSKQTITLFPALPNVGFDTTICKAASIKLSATVPGAATYQWSNGSTDSVITVSEAGTYWVRTTRDNCISICAFNISVSPEIWIDLGQEYFICEDEKELVKLDAGKGFTQYLWHPTGDTSQWIVVNKTGDYYVIVKDFRGCEGQDGTVVKRRCPGYLYFPNSFSANNDGLNDEFKPVGRDIFSYNLKIYSRWGELIFESDDFNKGWDGKINGIKAQEGIYLWISSYTHLDENKKIRMLNKSGTLQLMR